MRYVFPPLIGPSHIHPHKRTVHTAIHYITSANFHQVSAFIFFNHLSSAFMFHEEDFHLWYRLPFQSANGFAFWTNLYGCVLCLLKRSHFLPWLARHRQKRHTHKLFTHSNNSVNNEWKARKFIQRPYHQYSSVGELWSLLGHMVMRWDCHKHFHSQNESRLAALYFQRSILDISR